MTYYDEQLKQLQQQAARKRHLESTLLELYGQRRDLTLKVQELAKIKRDEQEDVDRLEGRSLAAFFYGVVGKKDEKLDKERQEAYAAAVKYDAAAEELSSVEEDIRKYEAEQRDLLTCEERYEQVLGQKAQALKAAGGTVAEEIFRLEQQIAALDSEKKEIGEAITAGQRASMAADRVLHELDGAMGWSTWDMFGGGMLTDMMKHSRLDNAQMLVQHLQVELRRFKTELADVTLYADLQVNIQGFMRFADYFFDGIFVDWMIRDQISQSREQIRRTCGEIQSVLHRLDGMMAEAEQKQQALRDRLDKLVIQTPVEQKGLNGNV